MRYLRRSDDETCQDKSRVNWAWRRPETRELSRPDVAACLALGFPRFERGHLLWRCLALEFLFPSRIGHAVDPFPSGVFGHVDPFRLSRFAVPVAEAVSAEIGKDHQIDILDVFAIVEMR